MNGIDWQPLDAIPEDRRDGRMMLVWSDGEPWVASWDDSPDMLARAGQAWGWTDARENGVRLEPIFWADINPPQ